MSGVHALRTVVAILALGVVPAVAHADDLLERYRTMSFEEPASLLSLPDPASLESQAEDDFFGSLEAGAHVGFLAYSKDFKANPTFSAGIGGRVGLPWFSHSVVGLDDKDAFGVFVDFSFSSIKRRIQSLDDRYGMLFFATLGADFTAYKDELFFVRPQLGVQYGYFGGVTDLHSGAALALGAKGGIQFSPGFWVTFNPQVAFGSAGDMVFFFNFGVDVMF